MSRRARVTAVAAIAVAAALGVVLGVAVLGSDGVAADRPEGAPPFVVDLGVRTDAEAEALRRASRAYAGGEGERAAELLRPFDSVQAEVGRALAAWPRGTRGRLEALADERPESGAVLFHLGLARFWDGDDQGALAAWRATRSAEPDSAFAVRAADLLFRGFPPGLPTFVPSFGAERGVAQLPAARQLPVLERRARRPDVRAKLLYGVALQRLDRPISARRQFTAAARLAPDDPEALAADAVGRFDKAQPSEAFSRLGPLARRFPRSASVRFHLGLLLLWLGQLEEARSQLRQAASLQPASLSREATRLLDRLEDVRRSE